MTRINIIPPEELMDQHLMAEYREMPMVSAALTRTLRSKRGLDRRRIPKQYTLNTGHVTFFYDKGAFLDKRYQQLVDELKARGYNLDDSRKLPVDVFKQHGLYGDYTPTPTEQAINIERITYRISQKPHWYRKTPRQS